MRRGTTALCAALAALVIVSSAASAETLKVDVTFTTKKVDQGKAAERTCIDKVTVVPEVSSCSGIANTTAKDVCIDPQDHWNRGEETYVRWTLKPEAGSDYVDGVSWWVQWVASKVIANTVDTTDFNYCTTRNNLIEKQTFQKPKFRCQFKNKNKDNTGRWEYKITADDLCDDAVVDPQIIFVGGGGEPPDS